MAKKRAPGAGRKPRGEFQGKSAVLTTRITPETRAALERAAAKGKNRSLSQVAEKALSVYLSMLEASPERGDHINALGEAVKLVAQYIERATGQRWNDDAFSGEAVRQGCGTLIAHFAPRGMPVTPRLIKEAAKLSQLSARTVSEFRDRVRSAKVSVPTTRKVLATAHRVKVIGPRDEGSKKITRPSKDALHAIINEADEEFPSYAHLRSLNWR